MKAANLGQLKKAAELWGQYEYHAKRQEIKARTTGDGGAMVKALVFRENANKLLQFLETAGGLAKGWPIKKRFKWKKMDVSIENPAGSVRKWFDPHSKNSGVTYMAYDYGYLRGTTGVDKDQVDVFFGPEPEEADCVYVVRQMKGPDFQAYDEDKCMIGFESADAAKTAYLMHYNDSRFFGKMDVYPVVLFVAAVKQTKKAPAPVGGWYDLTVPQHIEDLDNVLTKEQEEVFELIPLPKKNQEASKWTHKIEGDLVNDAIRDVEFGLGSAL